MSALSRLIKQLKDLRKKARDLNEQIGKTDPNTSYNHPTTGKPVNLLQSLQDQLAEVMVDIIQAEAQKAALGTAAGGTGQAAATQTASWTSRASRAGRAVINFGRWVVGKPPLPQAVTLGTAVVGVAAGVAVAAALTYVAANLLGGLAGDSSVGAGVRMEGIPSTAVPAPVSDQSTGELYGVFHVDGLGFYVGQESGIKDQLVCSRPGGGVCRGDGTDAVLTYQILAGDFTAYDEAVTDFCNNVSGTMEYWPLGQGYKATAYGMTNWLMAVYNCPGKMPT